MNGLITGLQLLCLEQTGRINQQMIPFRQLIKRVADNITVCIAFFILAFLYLVAPLPANCSENTAVEVERSVERSIQTRQDTNQKLEKWDAEQQELLNLYDELMHENQVLINQNKALHLELDQRRDSVDSLKIRQIENEKTGREIEPFLKQVYMDLNEFVLHDTPFLRQERTERMMRLGQIIEDVSLPITEKFRKVMEALFVEAEYGNTIEVIQQKIEIQGKSSEVLANILRLGRISMFALTLDHNEAAFYNVADKKWIFLGNEYLHTIYEAVEMANRQRRVDLLSMPLGRISVQ